MKLTHRLAALAAGAALVLTGGQALATQTRVDSMGGGVKHITVDDEVNVFDFPALLGDDVQIAATLNMRTIIERVSPTGRAIEVDTGFRRVHVLPAPQEREEQGGMKAGVVPRRAVDFTEYSLLRGMGLHPG